MRIWKIVRIGIIALVVLLATGLAATNYALTSAPLQSCPKAARAQHAADSPEIKCPFLKFVQPATTSLSAFAQDAEKAGMDYWMAIGVAMQVTWQQKGMLAALSGEVPDLYALERVPGVSHCDLYTSYIPELREMARDLDQEGTLHLQDLVSMKQWVAREEQVEIIESSRIETALLFVRAGGDFETGRVNTENVFAVLEAIGPENPGLVTIERMNRARDMADWGAGEIEATENELSGAGL